MQNALQPVLCLSLNGIHSHIIGIICQYKPAVRNCNVQFKSFLADHDKTIPCDVKIAFGLVAGNANSNGEIADGGPAGGSLIP